MRKVRRCYPPAPARRPGRRAWGAGRLQPVAFITTSAGCVDDMPVSCRPRRLCACSERRGRCQTSSRPGTWRPPRPHRSCASTRRPASAASRSRNGDSCRSSQRTRRKPASRSTHDPRRSLVHRCSRKRSHGVAAWCRPRPITSGGMIRRARRPSPSPATTVSQSRWAACGRPGGRMARRCGPSRRSPRRPIHRWH